MNDQKPPTYDAAVASDSHPYPVTVQPYPPTQHNAFNSTPLYPPPQQPYPPQQQYPPQMQQYPPHQYPQGAILVPPPYDEQAKGQVNLGGPEYQTPSEDVERRFSNSSIGDCNVIASFNEKSIRLGFIRKVFAIVGCQMLVTIGMTAWFLFHEPTNYYVKNNVALYIASYCIFLVLYIVLVCCSHVARKHPINLILLGLFTLSLGYLVAVISAFHETNVVLAAFGITVVCTGCVVAFASQTKYDVTKCSGVLFCLFITLILFGLFASILVPLKYMSIVRVVYASLGALIFMGFLAFDIQVIMGGRKYELSPEDYVFAALQLYVDVVYIFLFILQLFGGGK